MPCVILNVKFWLLQHEAGRAAFEDAQKQMNDILGKIETRRAGIVDIQRDLADNKNMALEARKLEQVPVLCYWYYFNSLLVIVFVLIWIG